MSVQHELFTLLLETYYSYVKTGGSPGKSGGNGQSDFLNSVTTRSTLLAGSREIVRYET